MNYTNIISAADLERHLGDPGWVILDCRFSLDDLLRGKRDYLESHIPGAIYVHLDDDLSGPVIPGKTSRHPLPEVEELAARFSSWGIGQGVQVVVYDDRFGAIAARAWWMLRWLGHHSAAVLDGGWPLWVEAGCPVEDRVPSPERREFQAHPDSSLMVSIEDVMEMSRGGSGILIDARDRARYHGEHEVIDPVAGHIPGAISAPFMENLAEDGRFLDPQSLRKRFEHLLGGSASGEAVVYCGSGVTSIHHLIAMEIAGLEMGRLFPGSWSLWITDQDRPVA